MKRNLFVALFAAFVLTSCESLSMLKDYEETLSWALEEEMDLIGGKKWMFSKVGYHLTLDDKYHVEHIVTDDPNYPSLTSSIESIEFGYGTFTVNFKERTRLKRQYWSEKEEGLREEDYWCTSYTATTDGPKFYFGFDDNNVEEFIIFEPIEGGVDYQFELYGKEKLNGYEISRMILSAGSGGIHTDVYYEFIPEK